MRRQVTDGAIREVLVERVFSLVHRRRESLRKLAEVDPGDVPSWIARRQSLGLDGGSWEVVCETAQVLGQPGDPGLIARAMLLAPDVLWEWTPELLAPVSRAERVHVASTTVRGSTLLPSGRAAVIDKIDYRRR